MTRDRVPSERRLVLPLVLAASLLAVLAYYLAATIAFGQLRGRNDVAALIAMAEPGLGAGARVRRAPQQPVDIRALAADPLDATAVSKVIVARAFRVGNATGAAREVGVLRRLGWRSTPALQLLLWTSAIRRDFPLMIDTLDALLRRERLLGEIYPVLNLMTQDPSFRARLVSRLAGRPPWRSYYFTSANELADPAAIDGRYRTLRAIQQRGDRLSRNEVAPLLYKLVEQQRGAQAFALWQAHRGGAVTRPLADVGFTAAALPTVPNALPVPFEWQLGNGTGYFVDARRDERGGYASIDWDGRGTPVLFGQTTSALPGRYRLDVTSEIPGTEFVDRFGFRLTCPGAAPVEFDPRAAGGGGHVVLVTRSDMGCAFPRLEAFGLVQPGGRAASVLIRRIQMRRIGG